MLSMFAKLFALRPFLSMAILGVPVITLVIIGFVALWAVKLLFFVVLPIVLVVWLVRKVMRPRPTVAEPVVHDL
ncbi:MAG: hypothetical protein V4617_20430 [Gemmatimonadota bacterium]